ncbi:MAG: PAS domain-containing protein [Candidatus Delongbacteria bacterium]|nr:PAS domain-containing protein [Candidatus Delongbacteria bacterium]MBN2834503.1 PAS domain-containing protein [Candidatus Delongbacteria bacterium]
MKQVNETNKTEIITHYVGIGASAGGLEAIESFFKNMPSDSNLAFIVVQHLSPDYKSLMVELLTKKTAMKVLRAEHGMVVRPNHVYLIPPKKNLVIFQGRLLLKDQDYSQGLNLPIDIFLKSLAIDQTEKAVAIILSGTGSDGTRGVREIKENNGMVMVQSEESAKFNGMPRAAIGTGLTDFILAPEDMPKQLMAFVKHPYESKLVNSESNGKSQDLMATIFAELRDKTKVDFTLYKPNTIVRRIERRMTVCQTANLEEYVNYIHNYPSEITTLYRELLIGVTSFFRDPEAFIELSEYVIPKLLQQFGGREIRFWIAGCSTGEEAYSLAIVTREAMEKLGISRDIKIFATDIDKNAILTAGNGVYPESIAADLSPKLLSKYFYQKGDHYKVSRNIREMVVFAQHNLVMDPPFTNIDLVSCRNLLIYLQPILQQKALQMFNFSLNPQGILFLGSSETVGEMADYFVTINQKCKLYEAKGKSLSVAQALVPVYSKDKNRSRFDESVVYSSWGRHSSNSEESKILTRFVEILPDNIIPLTVIVNEQLEIVYTLGNTEGFFKIPTGRVIYEITKMTNKELSIPLSTGIQKVFRTKEPITYTNIRMSIFGNEKNVKIKIIPILPKKGQEPLVAAFIDLITEDNVSQAANVNGELYDIGEEAKLRINDLEAELQFTKENLQATIEELETSNEELQATNEELLASNEELQSTNEELQSTNEELYTVNSEYQNKINELTELNNDVDNLLTSSRIGKLLLDEDLQIRRFSPETRNIFLILESDVGRPITHLAHKLVGVDPVAVIKKVLDNNIIFEQNVMTEDSKIYLMRVLPYQIGPKLFAGVVVTFVDITETIGIEKHLESIRRKSEDIIKFMPAGLFVYSYNYKEEMFYLDHSNPEAEKLVAFNTSDYIGKPFTMIWPEIEKTNLLNELKKVIIRGTSLAIDKFEYKDSKIEGTFKIQAFKLPDSKLAIIFEDISSNINITKKLKESEDKYVELFRTMAQGVVYQDNEGKIFAANPSAEKILGLTLDEMTGRTSYDSRWKAVDKNDNKLDGDNHPSMIALRTGKPVHGFIMGVHNPKFTENKWILVNATPIFKNEGDLPYLVYTSFEDITEIYKETLTNLKKNN